MTRSRFTPIVAAVTVALLVGLVLISPFSPSRLAQVSNSPATPNNHVTHVVLFQWKATADPDAIVSAHKRMLALRTECIHPRHHQPYIISLKGGRDHSTEGLQGGATHGYVVEFASVPDRDYYVDSDPAHKAFVKSIGEIVQKATVLDFTDGRV